MLREEEKTATR